MSNPKSGIAIDYKGREMDALDGADCLLICTEWAAFRTPDFNDMANRMNGKVIFDGRNLGDESEKNGPSWMDSTAVASAASSTPPRGPLPSTPLQFVAPLRHCGRGRCAARGLQSVALLPRDA